MRGGQLGISSGRMVGILPRLRAWRANPARRRLAKQDLDAAVRHVPKSGEVRMKTLRKGEMCPLHKSFYCCGRNQPTPKVSKKRVYSGAGVRRIEDEFHPRGYREICSASELRRRKHTLMASGDLTCFYCKEDMRNCEYSEIELCHIEPKGLGGARHDSHMENLALGHRICNLENGSKRPAA
jgi:hypothetical protein